MEGEGCNGGWRVGGVLDLSRRVAVTIRGESSQRSEGCYRCSSRREALARLCLPAFSHTEYITLFKCCLSF